MSSEPVSGAMGGTHDDWSQTDWTHFLRVKNRVAQALACYGTDVPDEALDTETQPSAFDLQVASHAANAPPFLGEDVWENVDSTNGGTSTEGDASAGADGKTEDALERRVRRFIPACRTLPKVELHAHLNGCVRELTLLDLAANKKTEGGEDTDKDTEQGTTTLASVQNALVDDSAHRSPFEGNRSLQACFGLFGAIHELCTGHDAITRVAAEAVVDFALDGVVYLELRTTPKDYPDRNVSKESYCGAVLVGMAIGVHVAKELLTLRGRKQQDVVVVARLILSIDRKETLVEAKRTVRLAAYLRDTDCGVVGVDVSGNPTVGRWSTTLEPALRLARRNGLPITLHCGEVCNKQEELHMLRFKPERLGHCVWTVRDDALWSKLKALKIPIELCITSNAITGSIEEGVVSKEQGKDTEDEAGTPKKDNASSTTTAAAQKHHLGLVHKANHPFTISTDDPGVFATSLSREYALAAGACGLRSEDLRNVSVNAFAFAFIHKSEAMNDDDKELTWKDIAEVTTVLRNGARQWAGLPAMNAKDAVFQTADAASSATKVALFLQVERVRHAARLFQDLTSDLTSVSDETRHEDADEANVSEAETTAAAETKTWFTFIKALLSPGQGDDLLGDLQKLAIAFKPRFAPGEGDFKDDYNAVTKYARELGLVGETTAGGDGHDGDDGYDTYDAYDASPDENTANRGPLSTPSKFNSFTVSRSKSRRDRFARRGARRRVVLGVYKKVEQTARVAPIAALAVCVVFGNWPLPRYGESKTIMRKVFAAHLAAAGRGIDRLFFKSGVLPTHSFLAQFCTKHLSVLGSLATGVSKFAETGAHGVVPTTTNVANFVRTHVSVAKKVGSGIWRYVVSGGYALAHANDKNANVEDTQRTKHEPPQRPKTVVAGTTRTNAPKSHGTGTTRTNWGEDKSSDLLGRTPRRVSDVTDVSPASEHLRWDAPFPKAE